MLDQCQKFKAEFLAKCAEEGLTIEQTHAAARAAISRLESGEKQAFKLNEWLRGNIPVYGEAMDLLKDRTGKLIDLGINVGTGALIGAPIAAGAGAGYGLAKLRNLDDQDPEEIKSRDMIQEYDLAAQRARLQSHVRKMREARQPRRPML